METDGASFGPPHPASAAPPDLIDNGLINLAGVFYGCAFVAIAATWWMGPPALGLGLVLAALGAVLHWAGTP